MHSYWSSLVRFLKNSVYVLIMKTTQKISLSQLCTYNLALQENLNGFYMRIF
jgi:hypothetical protein